MNGENEALSETEYKKKEKQLEAYKRIQREGIWVRSLKMAFGIAIGLSILPALNQPMVAVLPRFVFSFILGFILFLALWPSIGNKINHLTSELEQKKKIKKAHKTDPLHLLIFFILLAVIVSPLFFKNQFEEWDRKLNDYVNEHKIEKINREYSLEPVKVRLQFADGANAVLTAPKAYFALGNSYKKEGALANELSKSKVHLAAMLPDLNPWKIKKEDLDHLQERNHMLKLDHAEESTVYKILREVPDFVSINLIEASIGNPYEKDLISKKMLLDMAHSQEKVMTEVKYGLNIRTTKIAVPGKINGANVNFYQEAIIAEPIEGNYPQMTFICEAVCTILSNYHNSIGLAVSFHASNLAKWQDIWEKANSKVDNMLKWE